MKQLMQDVAAFHAAVGSVDATEVQVAPSPELIRLRLKLIAEETCEIFFAATAGAAPKWYVKKLITGIVNMIDSFDIENFDIEGVADGLADLIYVCVGAALAFGIPLDRVWEAVQLANMAKAGGPRRADGKILKPEGWKPPDIRGALFGKAA